MATGTDLPAQPTPEQWRAFEAAVHDRRKLVYDYLERWPGAAAFQPLHIHDALYSYIRKGGKALRPALLLFSCGAAGGDEAQALPAAAAVEVFHTWTLVHDDIIDRDDTRRGTPTVHAQYAQLGRDTYSLAGTEAEHYGEAVAILTGDLQQSWAYALLTDLAERGMAPTLVVELARQMATSLTPSLMEGEMLDVEFALTRIERVSESEVLGMLSKKTAALLEYSAWCGARIGLGGREDANGYASALGRFAFNCGVAFQLYDDLLGLTADEALLGKPVGSDLREGKHTLLVARALQGASEKERAAITSVLGNQSASGDEVKGAISAILETGAGEYVLELANRYIGQGLADLAPLPASEFKEWLTCLAWYMSARKY